MTSTNAAASSTAPVKCADQYAKYGVYLGIVLVVAFPRAGVLPMAVFGGIFAGASNGLFYAIGSFVDAIKEDTNSELQTAGAGFAVAGLMFGIISLAAWFLPIVGLPISLMGFILGRKGRLSSSRKIALAAMGLSLAGLVLTCVNAYAGAFVSINRAIEAHRSK